VRRSIEDEAAASDEDLHDIALASKSPMRLCFIGDAETIHTQRWVEWFAADHEVSVIATGRGEGLPEYKVATLPGHSPLRTRLFESVLEVRRVLRRHRPDILHGHFINEAGWFSAASGHRPFVITAWGSDLYRAPAESRLARYLNPWSVRRADWVTCDSHDQASVIRSWGAAAEHVSVVGWGVDRRQFRPGVDGSGWRAKLDIPSDAKVIVSPRQWYANSNIPSVVAGHELLPESFYLLLKRMPGFEPDNGRPVHDAIEASSARDRIRVVERVEPSELPGLYAAGDVAISLCTTDGTPVSVLEAMALGLPVVALENASLAEWVSDPGGRLVPGLDPQQIAQAVRSMVADAATIARAAEHNIAIVTERADREAEFARMDEIYERLVHEARR
jgi:glycosyltransferase involved in cell wall biosynthesis